MGFEPIMSIWHLLLKQVSLPIPPRRQILRGNRDSNSESQINSLTWYHFTISPNWRGWRGSNPLSLVWQTSMLPLTLHPQILWTVGDSNPWLVRAKHLCYSSIPTAHKYFAGRGGFEPPWNNSNLDFGDRCLTIKANDLFVTPVRLELTQLS